MSFSLAALAQNKTGTGGNLDAPSDPLGTRIVVPTGSSMSGGGNIQESRIYDFSFALQKQEKLCRSNEKRFIYLKNPELMDIYLKLSVLQGTFEADDKCSTVSEYFSCMYSSEVKKKLKLITEDPKMNRHLREKYKIKKKEAKGILEFFKTLDVKCQEKGACKV